MKQLSRMSLTALCLVAICLFVGFQSSASAQESDPPQSTGGEHVFLGILTALEEDSATVTLTQDATDGTDAVRFPAGTSLSFALTEDLRQNIAEEGLTEGDKVIATYDDAFPGTDLHVVAIGLPQTGFDDVGPRDYCADSVRWAGQQGITNGTSPNTFSPDRTCTQAQSLVFLWRSAGSPAPAGSSPFAEGNLEPYCEQAAAWAAEEGMVTVSQFSPASPCTRAMAVELLWKLAGSPDAPSTSFADVDSSAAYAAAVGWALDQGITNGTSSDTFSPDRTCTRGEMVTFLYRALEAGQ